MGRRGQATSPRSSGGAGVVESGLKNPDPVDASGNHGVRAWVQGEWSRTPGGRGRAERAGTPNSVSTTREEAKGARKSPRPSLPLPAQRVLVYPVWGLSQETLGPERQGFLQVQVTNTPSALEQHLGRVSE